MKVALNELWWTIMVTIAVWCLIDISKALKVIAGLP